MSLSAVRQAELHSDLKIQEKDELQWKKLKAEGLDETGEKEAQLRRNFNGEMPCLPFRSRRDLPGSIFWVLLIGDNEMIYSMCISSTKFHKTKTCS